MGLGTEKIIEHLELVGADRGGQPAQNQRQEQEQKSFFTVQPALHDIGEQTQPQQAEKKHALDLPQEGLARQRLVTEPGEPRLIIKTGRHQHHQKKHPYLFQQVQGLFDFIFRLWVLFHTAFIPLDFCILGPPVLL